MDDTLTMELLRAAFLSVAPSCEYGGCLRLASWGVPSNDPEYDTQYRCERHRPADPTYGAPLAWRTVAILCQAEIDTRDVDV